MRILIVDDSRAVRIGLRKKLEENGYEVHEAANGMEAVQKAKEIAPHLITMDVSMPDMNGFEATAEIRSSEEGKLIPIIFVTSKDSIKDREQGFYLGATEFISKSAVAPWQEVIMTVNRILRCSSLPEGFNALVVEDNTVTRMVLCNILHRQGIHVFETRTGQEALQIAEQHRADIDLVITDYMMPEMNGGELCAQLRGRLGFRHTPIIFLSGATEKSMILDMFQAGATDYIMKPFAKEELLARIRVHMEQWELVKELNRTVGQLELLNNLRDEFVAMATHDLKSPLNGIMGFSQAPRARENPYRPPASDGRHHQGRLDPDARHRQRHPCPQPNRSGKRTTRPGPSLSHADHPYCRGQQPAERLQKKHPHRNSRQLPV